MPRLPGRPSPSAERSIRAVLLFPDSAEIRDLDDVPPPGTRLRSASGNEWFVVEALQSGRDTYTVFCLGRRSYLEEFGTRSVRARLLAEDLLEEAARGSAHTREGAAHRVDDLADDLLQGVRRVIRDEAWRQRDGVFVASFVNAEGRLFQDLIHAKGLVPAQSQALERARSLNLSLTEVRPAPEWLSARYARAGIRRRWRRVARILRKVV